MAEKPEDLNLPNAVITRLIKEVVRMIGLYLLMLANKNKTKQSSAIFCAH